MADEKKTYLVNIESNLKKYADEATAAKKRVDELKASNAELVKSGTASAQEIEKQNAALRVAQKEYAYAKKSVDLATQANRAQKGSYEELLRLHQLAQTQLKLMGGAYTTNANGVRVLSQRYIEQSKVVDNAKKSLDAFGKGIHDNRLNVGNYSEVLQSALGNLELVGGKLKMAASAASQFGSKLMELIKSPIVLVIAAITGALTVLYKVFVSTAEGAAVLKDYWAGLKATGVELRNTVVDLYKASGKANEEIRFQGAAAAIAAASIDKYGNKIKSVAEIAMELSAIQRQLNIEQAYHISQEADENAQIQEYLLLAKDKTLADQERLDMLTEALRMSREKFDAEIGFAKRQFDIDIKNAALRARIDEKTLSDWIKLNDKEQNEVFRTNDKIKEAYNLLGLDMVTALEKSYAKQKELGAEFSSSTKRVLSQQTGLIIEIQQERIDALVEAWKTDEEAAKEWAKKEKERIKLIVDEYQARYKISKDLNDEFMKVYIDINDKMLDDLAKTASDELKIIEDSNKKKEDLLKADAEAGFEVKRINAGLNTEILNGILDDEYNALLKSVDYQELTDNQKLLAEAKYTQAKKELSMQRIDQLNLEAYLVADALGGISDIIGKETEAGKIFAIAQATINTWVAASQALRDPTLPSVIMKVAAMAAIIGTGFMTVKNIMKVNTSGKSSAAPGDKSVPGAGNAPPANLPQLYATQVQSTIFTQPQLTQTQLNSFPQQNTLTAEAIALAISKLPPPIVTVEDINVRINEVNKVQVRANI